MKPDYIGLGVQKSGTTWIYRILEENPQVSIAYGDDDKDIRFFSHFYDHGYEWYERHFPTPVKGGVTGEYSTSYFCSAEAPARIHAYNKDAKLIVCLRNPIDRVLSNHKHEIRLGQVSGENIDIQNGIENNPMYISQSMYYEQLQNWLKYFDRSNLLVLIFDDMINQPLEFAQSIYRFIGVDESYVPFSLNEKINEGRIIKNEGVRASKKKLSHILRSIGLGGVLDMIKRTGATGALDCAISDKNAVSGIDMSPQTRAVLQKTFHDDIVRLSKYLDRDLSFWK